MPPAFVLSQDQTLRLKSLRPGQHRNPGPTETVSNDLVPEQSDLLPSPSCVEPKIRSANGLNTARTGGSEAAACASSLSTNISRYPRSRASGRGAPTPGTGVAPCAAPS